MTAEKFREECKEYYDFIQVTDDIVVVFPFTLELEGETVREFDTVDELLAYDTGNGTVEEIIEDCEPEFMVTLDDTENIIVDE